MNLRGYAEVVLLTFVALWDGGCSTIRNINLYSTSEEVQLGQSLDKEIQKQYTVLDDSRVNSFLQERGDKLVAVSNRADIKYKFVAVKDEAVNAFAVPGGYCYINLGLIRSTETEAELISVVAHEISHVTNRHSMKRLSQMQIADLAQQAVLGNSGKAANMVASMFTTMGMLSYSRDYENQADHDGLLCMFKAGYDPNGMVTMFQMLKSKQEGPEPAKWQNLFSTHPMTEDRIGNAKALIATLPVKNGLIKNSDQWAGYKKYIAEKYPPPAKETKK